MSRQRTGTTVRRGQKTAVAGHGRRRFTEGAQIQCSVEKQGSTTPQGPKMQPNAAKFVHQKASTDSSEHSKPGNEKQRACHRWFERTNELGLRGIRQEFINKVRKYKPKASKEEFMSLNNIFKNRYDDVELLDKSRVKVSLNPERDDYIHASFVAVSPELTYICTQGPMTTTVHQFWLMCIQEDVRVILQLCANSEDGKEKCTEYFPSTQGEWTTYEFIEVKLLEKGATVAGMKKVSKTKLQCRYDNKVHTFTHLLYSGWPDHGVAESVATCREVRTLVHKLHEKKPIVAHCSAGIGRTGSFVAIEMMCHKLLNENNGEFNMLELMKELRDQRIHAIQNDQQYAFIYRCVLDIIVADDGIGKSQNVLDWIQAYDDMLARKRKPTIGSKRRPQ